MKYYRNHIREMTSNFAIKLMDGRIIYSENDNDWKHILSNNYTDTSMLTMSGINFYKNKVIEIEFFKPYPYENIPFFFISMFTNLKYIINMDLSNVK